MIENSSNKTWESTAGFLPLLLGKALQTQPPTGPWQGRCRPVEVTAVTWRARTPIKGPPLDNGERGGTEPQVVRLY